MLISMDVRTDGRVTLAELFVPSLGWTVRASSVRHPDDKNDKRLGSMIAIGRALEVLGKRMQRFAHGEVKHRDDMRNAKAVQRLRILAAVAERMVRSEGEGTRVDNPANSHMGGTPFD